MVRGSNYEVQTQWVLTRELDYENLSRLNEAEELSNEVGKMIAAIVKKLSTAGSLPANP